MKHIGLVLSGGMGKGAYQIGSLLSLSNYFKPSDFEVVSAASIGVLNTYAFLTDNLNSAREIWSSVNFKSGKKFITSILKSSFLQHKITSIISDKKIQNKFYAALLDISNKELNYYNLADIPPCNIEPYLQASIALPFYNNGISIGSKTLYDGAIVDNIPVYPVLENDLDYVICIYFDESNYVFESRSSDHKIVKLTFPDNKIISNSIHIKHESIMYMIEEGYNRTEKILSEVFKAGTDNLPMIYSGITKHNSVLSETKMRITGDLVVTNMNKLLKRFVRQKKILEKNSPQV